MVRLFRVSVPSSLLLLLITETILLFACYGCAAFLLRRADFSDFIFTENGIARIALVVGVILLAMYFSHLYDDIQVRSRLLLLQQISLALGIAFLVQAVASYGQSAVLLNKWMMMWGSLALLIVLPAWRLLFTAVIWKSVGAQRVLFVDLSPAVLDIIATIQQRPELGLTVGGYLASDPTPPDGLPPGVERLGRIEDLDTVIATTSPQRIVVSHKDEATAQHLMRLGFTGILVEDAASTYEAVLARVSTRDLDPSQVAFSGDLLPRPLILGLQTVYNLLLSLIAFIVTLPILLVLMVAVKLASRGPIFTREPQVGMNGAIFNTYRFRSPALRRFHLDELPRLINVLRGEMALVGPRAERPEFAAALAARIPSYAQHLSVRPGFTGWAQINYDPENGPEDTIRRLEYDLYYVKNLAPALDAYILLHTLRKIFARATARV
jgi:lipopolysaccharide/colanic/teichoic acid biosynthesis glycosyltransferase